MQPYLIAKRILPKPFRSIIGRRFNAQPEPLKIAFWNLWHEIQLSRDVRKSAKRFQTLNGKKGLKVHLGCGPYLKRGWVNIDSGASYVSSSVPSDTIFLRYDLRLGLPLDDDTCDYIYSSHLFEHLEHKQGLKLMRDCYRVLKSGGTFRISLPDFRSLCEAYIGADYGYLDLIDVLEVLPVVEPETKTLIDYVNYGVYQNGEHKCIYDEEKLITLLRRIGYTSVIQSAYQQGTDPDLPVRQRYSIYAEAVK